MAGKRSRPTAYIAPYRNGYFMLEPLREWVGKDYWGNTVGRGRTRRECEKSCRENGYVPVRE